MKRSNVSIFVPFAGCPNKCSFCDQHSITGQQYRTTPDDVISSIETALRSGGIDSKSSEIAFFGGSFTAIERDYMISLLNATVDYIDDFKGIRISTRPDCVNEDILSLLSDYKVTSIELGAQSMSDSVLKLNNRGHDSNSVITASELIKSYGFSLGLQMMTGLYGSNDELDEYTAEQFVNLRPDTVRIYPTVVLEGTILADLFLSGKYNPPDYNDAADLCAKLIPMFENENISVIRVGLHSSDTMESKILAGGYHPAFREICESRIFLHEILQLFSIKGVNKGKVTVFVSSSSISKATGQRKSNLNTLRSMGYDVVITADDTLSGRQILIQEG